MKWAQEGAVILNHIRFSKWPTDLGEHGFLFYEQNKSKTIKAIDLKHELKVDHIR